MITRIASKDEYPILARLFEQNVDESYITSTEEDYGRAVNGKWKDNLYDVVLEEMKRRSDTIILLMLIDNNKIIGYSFSSLSDPSHLEDLVIEKSYRSKGLGKFLISETIRVLNQMGYYNFRGEIGPKNLISQNLMKKFDNVKITIC